MARKREIEKWKPSLIIEFGKMFPEHSEENICKLLAYDRLEMIADYYQRRYAEKRIRRLSGLCRLASEKGYEIIGKEDAKLEIAKGNNRFMVIMNRDSLWVTPDIYPTLNYYNMVTFSNMNPRCVLKSFDLFCGLMEGLPPIVRKYLPKGDQLAKVAEVSHPYLKDRIEISGVLDGCEHRIVFSYSQTKLEINDPNSEDGGYYQIEITIDNIDDILGRLPLALADFGEFESRFPESAYCWDGDRRK